MPEGASRAEGVEPEEAPGPEGTQLPCDDTNPHGRLPKPRLSWRRIAVVTAGAAMTAAGAVVATLAATHKTAVHENAKAYAHGMHDALESVRSGFDPFDT